MLSSSPTIDGDLAALEAGAHDLVAADILDLADRHRHARRAEPDIFRPDAELDLAPALAELRRAGQLDRLARRDCALRPSTVDRHDVHARRADEIADESVLRPLEQLGRRADLHDLAVIHDDDLVGEGQRLGLVVRDIDHGVAEALVQLLQLRAQHPFHMRIDDGQRLVEQDGVDVGAHQPAAERDLLLLVGGQPARLALGPVGEVDHLERSRATLRSTSASGTPRLRSGKARLS